MTAIELKVGAFSKIRVWSEELPELVVPPGLVLEQRMPVLAAQAVKARRVGVEIYKPQGPRAIYALLGAEWTPDSEGELLIVVEVSGRAGALIPWAAAAVVDEVRVGLSVEHGKAILACAAREATLVLAGGRLCFGWGGEGAVGSNVRVFEIATRGILRLLSRDPAALNDAVVAEIFADLF